MAAQELPFTVQSISDLWTHAFAITPNDSADLPYVSRGLLLRVGGDVRVTMQGGEILVLPLTAGWNLAAIRRVWATDTTASGIVGGY